MYNTTKTTKYTMSYITNAGNDKVKNRKYPKGYNLRFI